MGLEDALRRLKHMLFPAPPEKDPFPIDAWTGEGYQEWFDAHKLTAEEGARQRAVRFECPTKFSIVVPLYETPLAYLEAMIASVLEQTYPHWELILVNASPENDALAQKVAAYANQDERMRVVSLSDNKGIAENTNAGIDIASGDFVCFLDHDDLLEPDVLYEYASVLEEKPIDLIYCDEDLVQEGEDGTLEHLHPYFKPAYSPEALLCTNYILHFLAIRKEVLDEIALADSSVDGTQDYRNILGAISLTDRVEHVNRVLYHWRICESSTAANPDAKPYDRLAARRSIGWYVSREIPDAQVIGSGIVNTQNLWFRPSKEKPVVSVVVDAASAEDARAFWELFSQTNSYRHTEVVVVLAQDGETGLLTGADACRIVRAEEGASRFTRFNAGAQAAAGEYLVFLDADASFQSPEPLEQMLGFCKREDIGVVAPKTLYADGSVRCYGVAVTSERIMPLYRGYPFDFPGYQCNTRSFQNNSAASYLGLMTPRALFQELGGFDEVFMGEIGATEYCHRVLAAGKRIVQMCTVVLKSNEACPDLHYDNATNASDFTAGDLILFDEKWAGARAAGDPYFNGNLDQSSSYFQIAKVCSPI